MAHGGVLWYFSQFVVHVSAETFAGDFHGGSVRAVGVGQGGALVVCESRPWVREGQLAFEGAALTEGFSFYNHIVMEQIGYIETPPNLDAIFHALADGTRRAILSRLIEGDASVTEIAKPFDISQPAVSRHLKVLERAGLVAREIDEQRRPAKLKAENMIAAVNWLADFRPLWGTSFSQLDKLLIQMKQET